ncbi:MAG: phosphoadenosine phosphosulfate reductase [Lysobacterales bacterium CG_4_9_14_3_um_filter_62_6]|nr:MAG: phosphoadenosine phosphosulfate reductase [Xanthomonadales bacterium CG_4_9_14_3_um_filter_62_6]
MNAPDLLNAANEPALLAELNRRLSRQSAAARVDWALAHLPGGFALSSSFGAQAAVSLHLLTQRQPDLPVILIDTGYLFPETLHFVEHLRERLALNLQVRQALLSPAQMERRYGALWQQGHDAIRFYNRIRKVEPMQQALAELGVNTWFAGIRRQQSSSRQHIEILERRDGRWKVHPLADWRDRDIGQYLQRFDLPYHPLWQQGYVSIGDTHSTQPWRVGMREEDTRFAGLLRECGLHA